MKKHVASRPDLKKVLNLTSNLFEVLKACIIHSWSQIQKKIEQIYILEVFRLLEVNFNTFFQVRPGGHMFLHVFQKEFFSLELQVIS